MGFLKINEIIDTLIRTLRLFNVGNCYWKVLGHPIKLNGVIFLVYFNIDPYLIKQACRLQGI
jgi:hypothetical protein